MFLAAHRALLKGTSPREPAAWLATIARNECWGRIRTRMREPLPTAEVDAERSLSDPLAEAIRNADLAAMWTAIAALPRQQRDALLLREFGGLSYDELAGALAVSGAAVESLLFRARQGVRTRVEAAFAGLTGGIWLESLTRLAAGLGAGMAPVAAKVAAVGVGAAVATGGAVFAPRLLDHVQRGHVVTRHVHVTRHLRPATTPTAATSRLPAAPEHPIFVVRSNARSPRAPAHPQTDEHGRDSASSSTGRSSGSSDRSDDPGEVRSAAETDSRHENSTGDGMRVGGGGGDSSSSGGGSGSGGDSSSSGGSSSGGESGSDDGGVLAEIPNPVATVTVAVGDDEPPSSGGDSSGGGG